MRQILRFFSLVGCGFEIRRDIDFKCYIYICVRACVRARFIVYQKCCYCLGGLLSLLHARFMLRA